MEGRRYKIKDRQRRMWWDDIKKWSDSVNPEATREAEDRDMWT